MASLPRIISLSGGNAIASGVYIAARALASPRAKASLNLAFAASIAARASRTPSSFPFDPAYAADEIAATSAQRTTVRVETMRTSVETIAKQPADREIRRAQRRIGHGSRRVKFSLAADGFGHRGRDRDGTGPRHA